MSGRVPSREKTRAAVARKRLHQGELKDSSRHRSRAGEGTAKAATPFRDDCRSSRIEALLIEMRHEQDVQLKRRSALQQQFDSLAEHVAANSPKMRRSSRSTP